MSVRGARTTDTAEWVPDVDIYAALPAVLRWNSDARSAMLAINDLVVAIRLLTYPPGPFGRARDDVKDAASYIDRSSRLRPWENQNVRAPRCAVRCFS